VGAVSLTGLKRDFDEEAESERVIAMVTKRAMEISRGLGYVGD